jgi:hypothetical protein
LLSNEIQSNWYWLNDEIFTWSVGPIHYLQNTNVQLKKSNVLAVELDHPDFLGMLAWENQHTLIQWDHAKASTVLKKLTDWNQNLDLPMIPLAETCQQPKAEACNQSDEDCDGIVDNGICCAYRPSDLEISDTKANLGQIYPIPRFFSFFADQQIWVALVNQPANATSEAILFGSPLYQDTSSVQGSRKKQWGNISDLLDASQFNSYIALLAKTADANPEQRILWNHTTISQAVSPCQDALLISMGNQQWLTRVEVCMCIGL